MPSTGVDAGGSESVGTTAIGTLNICGRNGRALGTHREHMYGLPSPFDGADDGCFDDSETFVPEHLPSAGPFLEGHHLLEGEDHVRFHAVTHEVFEERGVYDMTFGYNLARLNLDTRHPNAGYRYAVAAHDDGVLRAEFTPTTPFCPQSHTLAIGSFRAWNGLADRHEYDLVRVAVAPMHHRSEAINEQLVMMADEFRRTGTIDGDGDEAGR